MEKYFLYYGLVDDVQLKESSGEFENEDDAAEAAYALACAEYDARTSRSILVIMSEDELTEKEALEQYEMEREDNIDYFAEAEEDSVEEEEEDEDIFDEDLEEDSDF